MSGQADGHALTEDAKGWLDWFEKSGTFPDLVQAHKEFEAGGSGEMDGQGGLVHSYGDEAGTDYPEAKPRGARPEAESAQRAGEPAAITAQADAAGWDRKRTRYGKAAEIWAKTVSKMENDLHQVRKDLLDAFGGDEQGKEMEKELVGEIEGCLKTLDLSLHKELDGLSKLDPGLAAQSAIEKARRLVEQHLKHLDSDHFMQHVDDNPSGIKVREALSHALGGIHDVLKA